MSVFCLIHIHSNKEENFKLSSDCCTMLSGLYHICVFTLTVDCMGEAEQGWQGRGGGGSCDNPPPPICPRMMI